jgi:hypothetical protein
MIDVFMMIPRQQHKIAIRFDKVKSLGEAEAFGRAPAPRRSAAPACRLSSIVLNERAQW